MYILKTENFQDGIDFVIPAVFNVFVQKAEVFSENNSIPGKIKDYLSVEVLLAVLIFLGTLLTLNIEGC